MRKSWPVLETSNAAAIAHVTKNDNGETSKAVDSVAVAPADNIGGLLRATRRLSIESDGEFGTLESHRIDFNSYLAIYIFFLASVSSGCCEACSALRFSWIRFLGNNMSLLLLSG